MKNTGLKKKADPQKENAYILYMIIGSLFSKTYCQTRIMEDKLYLSYVEMNRNTQEAREKQVIDAAEKALGPLCDLFSEMRCEAHIVQKGDTCCLEFCTGFEGVHADIDPRGNYTIELRQRTL